jgi:hypothetical protein
VGSGFSRTYALSFSSPDASTPLAISIFIALVFQRGRIDECLWEDVTRQLTIDEERRFLERNRGRKRKRHVGRRSREGGDDTLR